MEWDDTNLRFAQNNAEEMQLGRERTPGYQSRLEQIAAIGGDQVLGLGSQEPVEDGWSMKRAVHAKRASNRHERRMHCNLESRRLQRFGVSWPLIAVVRRAWLGVCLESGHV